MRNFNIKKHMPKVLSGVMSLTILCSMVAVTSYSAGAESTATAPKTKATATDDKSVKSTAERLSKNETVYVIADANGSAKKVIVSDWIKNTTGAKSFTDVSELENIENVNGDETFTVNENNMYEWRSDGKDIYYQGTSSSELPVGVNVTYKLDGKEIAPEKLAGKSGKVTIRFDYSNRQFEKVKIDGKEEKIYVPFVMITGMMLDNDSFGNVEVTNGKVINDGSHTYVAGFALPGMQESLDIDSEDFEIPNYVEITAEVENFQLATTLTLATNEMFSNIDFSKLDEKVDELNDKLDDLTSATNKLIDGSSELYDGLETLLKTADKQITAAGVEAKSLTIENYSEVLSTLISSMTDESLQDIAYSKAFEQVSETVNSQYDAIRSGIENEYRKQATVNALLQAEYSMTYEEYESAVASQAIPAEIQIQITSGVADVMALSEAQAQIDGLTQSEIEKIIESNMNSDTVKQQIESGVEQLKAGREALSSLKEQLDSYNVFYNGVLSYTAGVDQANAGAASILGGAYSLKDGTSSLKSGASNLDSGAAELKDGSAELKNGTSQLKSGTSTLSVGATTLFEGLTTLKDGGGQLLSGVSQLADGSMTLNKGLKQYKEEGVDVLVEAVDGDVQGLIDRFKAISKVSSSYRSFSGISDDMDGKVDFIFKTDSVESDN